MMKIRGSGSVSGAGFGAGGAEALFMWASAIPVPVVPLAPPFSFGMNERGKLASSSSSSSLKRDKEKGKRKRAISEDAESYPTSTTLNNHDRHLHNLNDDTIVSFYEPVSDPLYEPGAVGPGDVTTTTVMAPPLLMTTTTCIIHGADDVGGDLWEHEQETGCYTSFEEFKIEVGWVATLKSWVCVLLLLFEGWGLLKTKWGKSRESRVNHEVVVPRRVDVLWIDVLHIPYRFGFFFGFFFVVLFFYYNLYMRALFFLIRPERQR